MMRRRMSWIDTPAAADVAACTRAHDLYLYRYGAYGISVRVLLRAGNADRQGTFNEVSERRASEWKKTVVKCTRLWCRI